MKRLSLFLIFALVLSLTACGGSGNAPAATEADSVTQLQPADSEPATEAVPVINRAPSASWDISAEILTIAPVYGVYTQSDLSYKATYTELVCECITTTGEMAYLYLTVDDYLLSFDAAAHVESASFATSEMVVFSAPVHIDGMTVDANTIVDGLADSIGSTEVIHLGDFQHTNGTVEDTAYHTDIAPMVCVYAEILSIEPTYTLSSGSSLTVTDVVCTCVTADGDTIYVAISVEDYNAYIDPDASLSVSGLASFEVVTFEPAATIHGVSVEANKIASGLAENIGCQTVFFFGRMD